MFTYLVTFTCIGVVTGDQIVAINEGQLNGTILRSRDDKPFYAFYGIPYAAAPVGKLRYSEPENPPSWEGIRDATRIGPVCLQHASSNSSDVSFIGQEDCLYLSVFTPQIKPDKLLSVLVYIHGGGFYVGSGDEYGPHFFMDKPVVMVTMNYRLGIFGFLSAGDSVVPGNYGLKDQAAALKWVQSNIVHFGGDPKSVTIQGQSSGSECVHLHTMSPRSKGLFHRAIMQSGTALSYLTSFDGHDSERAFIDVARRVNCQLNTTVEVLSCLRNISAELLITTANSILADERTFMKFKPTIEEPQIKNAFLTIPPRNFPYQNTSIPWILGFNSIEQIFGTIDFLKKFGPSTKELARELDQTLSQHNKYFKVNTTQISNVTATLLQFYFKNGTVSENDQQQICNLFSDLAFGMPMLYAAYNYPGPKYFYYYDYRSNASNDLLYFNTTSTYNIKGARHGEEMRNFFLTKYSEKLNETDVKNSQKMLTYWMNFIINGTPNSQTDNLPRWDLFEPETSNYLYIGNDKITSQKQLLRKRYAFWKKLTASP